MKVRRGEEIIAVRTSMHRNAIVFKRICIMYSMLFFFSYVVTWVLNGEADIKILMIAAGLGIFPYIRKIRVNNISLEGPLESVNKDDFNEFIDPPETQSGEIKIFIMNNQNAISFKHETEKNKPSDDGD